MFASYDICAQLRLVVRSKGEGDPEYFRATPGAFLSLPEHLFRVPGQVFWRWGVRRSENVCSFPLSTVSQHQKDGSNWEEMWISLGFFKICFSREFFILLEGERVKSYSWASAITQGKSSFEASHFQSDLTHFIFFLCVWWSLLVEITLFIYLLFILCITLSMRAGTLSALFTIIFPVHKTVPGPQWGRINIWWINTQLVKVPQLISGGARFCYSTFSSFLQTTGPPSSNFVSELCEEGDTRSGHQDSMIRRKGQLTWILIQALPTHGHKTLAKLHNVNFRQGLRDQLVWRL